MTRASTTGVWAGEDPREAASRGATLAADEQGLLPFPLMSGPAAGGTRWACDSLGLATQLLPGLPADIGPAGWRLLGSRAATAARTLDARREQSRLGRALDALGEYAESSDLPVLLSVPGPWTLVRRLGLPDGSPVLRDSGARRDVIQSYAHGLLELREKIAKTVAEAPFSAGAPSLSEALAGREASTGDGVATGSGSATGGVVPARSEDPLEKARIRLVEDDLDHILTGTVPTVSGFRTLPAIPDTHVVAALRSVAQRTGPHTILSLPTVGTVRISGKDVAHTDLAADADLTQLAVPVSSSSEVTAARIRQWERIAAWTEERRGLWLRVPATAASAPESVASWVEAVAQPWTGVGMARSGLAGFGILTGEELPTGSDPLLPETASGASSRAHVRMAGALARAFADQAG